MAYTPKTFVNGEVLKAEHLNQMQQGFQSLVDEAKAYADQKTAEIVGSSPEALDTLNELAKALGNDENFAATMATNIGKKADRAELTNYATKSYVDSAVANGGGTGGGSSTPTFSWLSADSTGTDFDNAVQAWQTNKTQIIFFTDVDICFMVSFTNSENTAPICYFLNARTKQIIEVINGGNKVKVYTTDLKYTIKAVFTEEEMDDILNNARDDSEGECYQYFGQATDSGLTTGSVYKITRKQTTN